MNSMLKTLLAGGTVAASLLAGAAQAQMPDTSAGKRRAGACFACHGEDGYSKIPGYPHLAGQNREYLIKSLTAYRDGSRPDPTMNAMAKPLSDKDILDIAAYFEKLGKVAE